MIRRKILPLALLLLPALAAAGPSIRAGKTIVSEGTESGVLPCATCHGVDGAGQAGAGFPRLAGLNGEYIVKQLGDFKSGKRNNAIMAPIAAGLTEKEMADVAAYFSSLETPAVETDADNQVLAKGEKLAMRGNWDNNVPACFRCHGKGGSGTQPHFPPIAGQHSDYIATQLTAWKNGERSNDPLDLMGTIAQGLSDDDIAAVAAYLASIRP